MKDWVDGIKQADPLIFHPKRLLIMSLLIAIGPMAQGDLKKKCKITWGVITNHLERLTKAGYITQKSVVTLKGTRVEVKVTLKGLNIYKETLANFQSFIDEMEKDFF